MTPGPNILLLDEPAGAEALQRAFRQDGREAVIRATGKLADFLQWTEDERPDWLVMEAAAALTRIHSLASRLPDGIPVLAIGAEAALARLAEHLPNLQTASHAEDAVRQMCEPSHAAPRPAPHPAESPARNEEYSLRPMPLGLFTPRALAIGSSTGGPQALLQIFGQLKGRVPHLPVFITQHMPPKFTQALAEQIQQVSGAPCAEGQDGETALPGRIYIAPGNYHMTVREEDGQAVIRLNQDPPENFCRPAVDVMLRSLADLYQNRLLVVILTGMGSDGLLGARLCTARHARLIGQDKATSVVWGMPRAVAEAGICNAVLPLAEIAPTLADWCGGTR